MIRKRVAKPAAPAAKTAAPSCGTALVADPCPLRRLALGHPGGGEAMPGPERLVGLGFRYWMLGRRTGDIGCWERAWSLYSGMFGPFRARLAVGALSDWVVALGSATAREIELGEMRCGAFCRDECLAISMIAACQHNACPALRACAFALIESGHITAGRIDGVTAPAQTFADTMASLDQVLSPSSIFDKPLEMRPVNRLPS